MRHIKLSLKQLLVANLTLSLHLLEYNLNEIRSYLHELKAQNIDLLKENTAGHSLISHIVFSKLPLALKRELVHRLGNTYPTITEIFDDYNEAITTLNTTLPDKKTSFNKVSAKTAKTSSKVQRR